MEVNLNSSLNCDSQLDLKVKSHVLTDLFNIIGDIPFLHDGKFTPLEKANNYKTPVKEDVTESLCKFESEETKEIGSASNPEQDKKKEKELTQEEGDKQVLYHY